MRLGDRWLRPSYHGVVGHRLRARLHRIVVHLRQPRKLASLPFAIAATVLAVYALVTDSSPIPIAEIVRGS